MSVAPRLVIFGCQRSAGESQRDLALPPGVEWVTLPCGSGVDVLHLLRAIEAGAECVWVLACYTGACQSLEGDRRARQAVAAAHRWLVEIGLDVERITLREIAPNMSADLAAWLQPTEEPHTP